MADRYRLVESIGQGGMGRVWRATYDILDRQVAVKEMRIDGLDPEDSRTRRERTLREARATARIDHPHVVRVYDVVDAGDRLWIVMELVDGRSLEQLVAQDGPLDVRATARIGLQLVDALGQVHAQGVLHRDIKPANVLVKRAGAPHAVLTDFGIAALHDAEALTMAGMLVGSPDYMAPERVSGRPQGPPSDLWSLGATLCAALGRRSPFSRATTLATLHAVLYEEPELPTAAGPLHDLLAALLKKEPESRPGVRELTETLRHIATDPPTTTPTTWPGPSDDAEEPEAAPAHPAAKPAVPPEPTPTARSTPIQPTPTVRNRPTPEPAPHPHPHPEPAPHPRTHPDPRQPTPPASDPYAAPTLAPTSQPDRPTTPVLNRTPSPPRSASSEAPPVPSSHPRHTEPAEPAKPTEPADRAEPATPTAPPAPRPKHRRPALVAATTLAATAAVAAVLVPALNGSRDERTDKPSSSASHSSETPTGTPAPTVAGTSRPPRLPPGARTEAGVFAWVPPDGFSREVHAGAEVHYTSPDARQEIVGKASLARGDLMEQWRKKERSTGEGPGYTRIRLEETEFRGEPAVVWEYTVTAQELPWHVRSLGFNTGGKSYQLTTWYHPDIEDRALPVYEKVEKTFTPL
ncbi:serine/threonine-protein kinase [Streptomyces stelliscabiei]|uniref:serine/threonine-protein kinase n=1 Tax=Streptomyces stelliscabiei TaxID=146820 RepID=UPI0038D36A12